MNKPTFKLGGNLKKNNNNKIQSNTKSTELYIGKKTTNNNSRPFEFCCLGSQQCHQMINDLDLQLAVAAHSR